MRLTSLDLGIFILYMLAVMALGLFAARRGKKTKRDYFLAGDRLPWWMIGGSIIASNVSSHHLIGIMGTAYSRGFVAILIVWGSILIGYNALLWIFLPFYLRNGFYTVPEFLHRRFGHGVRATYGALILITYVVVEIAAVLYMGALAFYALFDVPISVSIVILAVATGLYTITGGLRAVVWTEMLQLSVLILGGVALSWATIRAVGGWPAVMATSGSWDMLLPADDPDFPWTMYLGGSLCVSIFYCAANQFIVQRALAAKDEWHARMGIVFAQYLTFLMPLMIIVPGLVAPLLLPDLEKADLVFPQLVEKLLPSGLVGLVMAGLIAAIMGHTSGAINSCTTIAAIDFYLPFKRWRARRHPASALLPVVARMPVMAGAVAGAGDTAGGEDEGGYDENGPAPAPHDAPAMPTGGPGGRADADSGATDAQTIRFARGFGIVVIIVGATFAELMTQHSDKPIFLYLLNAYGYFTPGIATMFLLGILWRRTTSAGALAAGILTIPLSLAIEWIWPGVAFQNRTGIVFWACMVTCVGVSLVTKSKPASELEGLIWNKESLRMPPDQRHRYRGLRRPVIWWALVTATVLFFYIRFA